VYYLSSYNYSSRIERIDEAERVEDEVDYLNDGNLRWLSLTAMDGKLEGKIEDAENREEGKKIGRKKKQRKEKNGL
jgi:hypothetical protein